MVVFCEMNIFLLSSLPNMINDSGSAVVGGRWVNGKVVRGLILIFSILAINKKQISHSNL